MADQNVSPEAAVGGGGKNKFQILMVIMIILNTLAVAAIAFMVFQYRRQEAQSGGIDAVVRGEIKHQKEELESSQKNERVLYQLKDFVVNLSGSRGRRILKTSIEVELANIKAKSEFETMEAQIRDQIILILSSKTYEEISTREGKESLRNEIKMVINPSLTEGNKILNVYFTDFIYN